MTRETALDRIQKAEEAISKKQATILRKQKTIEKKINELRKLGIEYTGERVTCDRYEALGYDKDTAWNAYWLGCDIDTLHEDIRRAEKDIAEKEQKIVEYQKALAEADERLRIIENDIPQALKDAKDEMVDRWTEYDLRDKEKMIEDRRSMEYKEFFKKWSYSRYEELSKSAEAIRKQNDKDATVWLLDLYNRVKDITGEIIDAKHLRWGGKALNGYVVGKDGTAEVTTIGAGGYNIQRYHLRVLVHRMN